MSGKHLQPTMNICKRENRCLIETVTGIIIFNSDEEKEKCLVERMKIKHRPGWSIIKFNKVGIKNILINFKYQHGQFPELSVVLSARE